ncbi:MAG: hypothetical protein RUMPE_01002 [Eubacteriales bacterium SKADARSKE-1]|nr:hypothetical protein [Eubacteriales bacterium SKADARSKE-1]
MINEKIKEFYTQMAAEKGFKEKIVKVKEKYKDISDPKEKFYKITNELILPLAKQHGFNFTKEELLEYEKQALSQGSSELGEEDLESISGGFGGPFVSICLSALMGISSLAGITSSVASYAPSPSSSDQDTHSSYSYTIDEGDKQNSVQTQSATEINEAAATPEKDQPNMEKLAETAPTELKQTTEEEEQIAEEAEKITVEEQQEATPPPVPPRVNLTTAAKEEAPALEQEVNEYEGVADLFNENEAETTAVEEEDEQNTAEEEEQETTEAPAEEQQEQIAEEAEKTTVEEQQEATPPPVPPKVNLTTAAKEEAPALEQEVNEYEGVADLFNENEAETTAVEEEDEQNTAEEEEQETTEAPAEEQQEQIAEEAEEEKEEEKEGEQSAEGAAVSPTEKQQETTAPPPPPPPPPPVKPSVTAAKVKTAAQTPTSAPTNLLSEIQKTPTLKHVDPAKVAQEKANAEEEAKKEKKDLASILAEAIAARRDQIGSENPLDDSEEDEFEDY